MNNDGINDSTGRAFVVVRGLVMLNPASGRDVHVLVLCRRTLPQILPNCIVSVARSSRGYCGYWPYWESRELIGRSASLFSRCRCFFSSLVDRLCWAASDRSH